MRKSEKRKGEQNRMKREYKDSKCNRKAGKMKDRTKEMSNVLLRSLTSPMRFGEAQSCFEIWHKAKIDNEIE